MGILLKSYLFKVVRKLDDLFFHFLGPVRVLFVVRNKMGFACQIPIIHALERKKIVFKVAVTLEFDGCMKVPVRGGEKIIFDRYYISHQKAVWKKWHFVITTDLSNLYFRRHVTKVCLNHGTGFGNLNNQGEIVVEYSVKMAAAENIHLCFENSINSYKNILLQIPSLGGRSDKLFFVTGFPKTDLLFRPFNDVSRRNFLQGLGLPAGRKCIVVFSHWTEKALLRNCGMAVIRELLTLGHEYNIIINGHEKLWFDPANGASAPIDLHPKIRALALDYPNLKMAILLDDPRALLGAADLFITDYSSIFVECCAMNKPILFFDNPHFTFHNEHVAELYKAAAHCFKSPDNIVELCYEAQRQPDNHKKQRKAVVDFFLSRQGEAAYYIADLMVKMGRVSGPSSPGWSKVKQLSRQEMQILRQTRKL